MLEKREWERCVWLGGRWRGEGCTPLPVRSPASGELLAIAGEASSAVVAEAVDGAARAQLEWSRRPAADRAAILSTAAERLADHEDEAVWWLVHESGSIARRARGGVRLAAQRFADAQWTAERAGEELALAGRGPSERSIARRVPLGVVAVITPWNSPLVLAVRALAPALAAGNAVVLKPDPRTPVSGGVLLAAVLDEAGLPPGVLQVVPGGASAGEALVSAPNVAKVSFTGSTATGRRVAELAGRSLRSVALELGGNNALVVLDDADVDAAVDAGIKGSFGHQGQICMATGRHLVHAAVADEYIAALVARAGALQVGDPASGDVDLGPLISGAQADRVQRLVEESVADGAVLRCGGRREGNYYWPTVLTDVSPSMAAFSEEVFGPVAPVTMFSDTEEAVALAEQTPYGLVASVFGADGERAMALLDRLHTGVGHLNDETVKSDATAPFGGMGWSGNGARYGALCDAEEFTTWRWLTVRELDGDTRPGAVAP